ncbi:hypothetical protein EI010_25630, partial [Escherichia coli]|nr:hypothetical protein [Escherichia coli]
EASSEAPTTPAVSDASADTEISSPAIQGARAVFTVHTTVESSGEEPAISSTSIPTELSKDDQVTEASGEETTTAAATEASSEETTTSAVTEGSGEETTTSAVTEGSGEEIT